MEDLGLLAYALKHPEHGTMIALLAVHYFGLRRLIRGEQKSRKRADRFLWRHIELLMARLKMPGGGNGVPPAGLGFEETTLSGAKTKT